MELTRRVGVGAGVLWVWGTLTGLTLVRFWAVLYGHVPGKAILILAAVCAAVLTGLGWRFRVWERLQPFGARWQNLLVFVPAFVVGAALDTSLAQFDSSGMFIGTAPFRLASALGSGLVLGVLALALFTAGRRWGRLEWPWKSQLLALALVLNVITALYCSGSATIYYWDNTIYWNSSTMLAGQPLDLAQLRLVAESIITQEYNYLLAFPISLVMRLLGTSRYVFLFSAVNLYVLPAMLGIWQLGRRVKRGGLLLTLLSPMLLYTALVGFVDVAAAGLGIWAVVVYTDTGRPAAPRGILAGAMLTGTFLLRRYFFFFALTFGLGAALANLAFRRRAWRDFLWLFASAAATSLFCAQSFLVEKVASVRYGEIYSAYDQGRTVDLMIFTRYYGAILLIVALALGIYALVRRPKARWTVLLVLVQALSCLYLFTRIQSHGQQHLLLYLPAFLTLLAVGLEALPRKRPVVLAAWALALCTAFITFLPTEQPESIQAMTAPPLTPNFTYQPPRRGDIAQLIALKSHVDGLSAQEPKTAAIVASSFTLNPSLYDNIYRSVDIPEPDAPETEIIYMSAVDKRDGFSWNVLTADYLVVGDPVQTHLGEENQQVVALLAHQVLEGWGAGSAFRSTGVSFALDDGARAVIYERTRDVTAEEYRQISELLIQCYPDYAQLYQAPAWTAGG